MIPLYSRVAAIDDDEDHLQKIVWGLGKAGFSAIPFFCDDGKLENPPNQPLPGLRIVFTDIHMIGGGTQNEKTHASNIIKCLKQIVSNGPYVLIFWSQFPEESDLIAKLIQDRASAAGLTPPVGHAAIDKKDVFNPKSKNGPDAFDANKLRTLILEKIKNFKTLAVAVSWEDRVARAAARTTDRLFDLVQTSGTVTDDWGKLLAFLACEAVGQLKAKDGLTEALDEALLPLLEDQLALIGNEPTLEAADLQHLNDIVSAKGKRKCPEAVETSSLNTSYLIEQFGPDAKAKVWVRGTVTELGSTFVMSGALVSIFGCEEDELVRREFAPWGAKLDGEQAPKLHVVELGPECDHVQGKVSTHRYLLALLVPDSLIYAFIQGAKKGEDLPRVPQYGNGSIVNIGKVSLRAPLKGQWHLLISCRCFMALAPGVGIDGEPRFRLRRALLEEVAHHYATHVRRPGVMRFHG